MRNLDLFHGGSVVENLPAVQEMQVESLGWEAPLEKEMATHSSILAWAIPSHGRRSLAGYSPWGCKESDTTKGLSAHSVLRYGALAVSSDSIVILLEDRFNLVLWSV